MADALELRAQMNGLVTEPSSIIAGSGGLAVLDNAMCRSPGLIEPRAGVRSVLYSDPIAAGMDATVYVREWNSLGTSRRWFAATDGTDTKVYAGSSSAVLTTRGDEHSLRAEPFAGRQCWTYRKALRMLDASAPSPAVSLARLPGAPRAPAPACTRVNATIAVHAITPNDGAAYRVVFVRVIQTDSGEQLVYGAPSDRVVFWNRDGGGLVSCDVQVKVTTDLLRAGDRVQIYRTPTPTTYPVDPGDEMVLINSYTLPSLTADYTFVDSAPEGSFGGPALYTNDSQEGIGQSNYRIRLASDVAYYNGMAFYAQASRGYVKDITLSSIYFAGQTPATYDGSKTLFSTRITADVFIGTTLLVNVAPTVASLVASGALVAGQIVNVGTADPEVTTVPLTARLVSWDAGLNTLTVDTNATGTSLTQSLVIWDWVGIVSADGTALIYPAPEQDTTALFGADSGVFYYRTQTNETTLLRSFGGSDMERAWAARHRTTGTYYTIPRLYTAAPAAWPYATNVQLRWEYDDDASAPEDSNFNMGQFRVVSSKPAAFSETTASTILDNRAISEKDGGPARLAISKAQQPEAVPLLSWIDIGDTSKAIVRIVALTDRLLVLKADGLWVVYGSSPEDLVVQPMDPTCRMASSLNASGVETIRSSQWVRRLGDTVYAWTLRGIVAIDSSGVRNIDQAIGTDIRAVSPTSDGYNNPLRPFSAASMRDNLIVFGREGSPGLGLFRYVYHTESGTWSTWSSITTGSGYVGSNNAITGSGDSDAGTMWMGSPGGVSYYSVEYPLQEVRSVGEIPGEFADVIEGTPAAAYLAFTVLTVTGATFTASVALELGTVITQGGAKYMIIDATVSDYTVDRAGLALGAASIEYFPIVQTITYSATTQGAPSVDKTFTKAYFGFQRLRGGTKFSVTYSGRSRPSAEAVALTEQYPVHGAATELPNAIGINETRAYEVSRSIPKAQSRGTGLEVTLRFNQAAVYQAIDSIVISYAPKSTVIGGRS